MDKVKKTVSIIDYGMGNIGSIRNSLERLNVPSNVVKSEKEIMKSTILILPGVGAFDQAVKNLHERKIFNSINYVVKEKMVPTLGICLGAQLACKSSVENGHNKGFGWHPSEVKELHASGSVRVPHVGWNSINYLRTSILLKNLKRFTNFYFDHSFYISESKDTISSSNHGKRFSSILQRKNIVSVQFHPEKSSQSGLQFLKNFIKFSEEFL